MRSETLPLEDERALLKRRILIALTLMGLILLGAVRLYMSLSDDFRLANISYQMPYQVNWEIPPLSKEQEEALTALLQQEFAYLGKGSQCYVFTSKDGEHVLKFFKFKHVRPHWFTQLLLSAGLFKDYGEKLEARRARKLQGVFNSHKLAYERHRSESGLEFIQLNCSGNVPRIVHVQDKVGIRREIHLENLPFMIQKRGQPLDTVLDQFLLADDLPAAKACLKKVFDLYASEYAKGIYDRDHHVMRNVGFAGDEALHLDLGKLARSEEMMLPLHAQQDAQIIAHSIGKWLGCHHPHYLETLTQYMDERLNED